MSTLAAFAGARVLRDLGVASVSGVAGESYLPLLEGLRREGIPFVHTSHEAGAAFHALGQARMTGTPGFVAVTRGPGAANAMIGVYEAMQSETPIVLLVGQVDTTLRHRRVIQEMEIEQTFASTTKATIEVTRADRVAPALLAAYRKSLSGRPGPVVLSLPTDHLYGEIDAGPEVPDALRRAPRASATRLGDDDLATVVAELESARRSILVLGRPFSGHRYQDLVEKVASITGAGVVGGHSCLDVFDHDSESWIGASTVRSSATMGRALAEAELILVLGHEFGDRTSQGYRELNGRLLSINPHEVGSWDEYLQLEHLAADPATALEQLAGAVRSDPARVDAGRAWVAELRRELWASRDEVVGVDVARDRTEGQVPMSSVVTAFDAALPERALIASDVGTFNDWFTRYLPFPPGRRYLGPTGNPMGCALPSALGAHVPSGVDRTVVLVGDGGFLMSATELATLARLGLPVTVAVFVNGVWGSIARDQDATFGVRYGTELGPTADMVALARSFGIDARRVDDAGGIADALAWSFALDGPSLVEFRTRPRRLSPADIVA